MLFVGMERLVLPLNKSTVYNMGAYADRVTIKIRWYLQWV